MPHIYQYILEYLVVSFTLGATWHMVLFPNYYKRLAIYSRIENPRFIFGLSAMITQGVVFAYLYPIVGNTLIFTGGLFLLLESFAVFTEVGKQNTTSLSGFVVIQTAFCLIQTLFVALAFHFIPLW
jgi:hypothetical protein